MITQDNLKKMLQHLGFSQIGNSKKYKKEFKSLPYTMEVDFTNKKLIYPKEITIHDDTTSNFSHPENFVVFECVHRLLEKGYKPQSLELEPKWKLGREAKSGKADILVRDLESSEANEHKGNPYLIIECKTSAKANEKSEFAKEWDRMQENGGQLFSYFQQERAVKFLCLYTSDFVESSPLDSSDLHPRNDSVSESSLMYENYILNMTDNEEFLAQISQDKAIKGFKEASSVEELFVVWSDVYSFAKQEAGIFEKEAQTYKITALKPTLESLEEFSSRDIQKKRHEWATILRANAVNDRNLALVKLMNLFLCKITDELENPNNLQFYYNDPSSDTPFDLVDRLQQLYQKGMEKYLNEKITYYSQDSIDEAFKHFTKQFATKTTIDKIFRDLKYFQNGDFNFIEVYNQKLFLQNFKVLLPLVQSLQNIGFTKKANSNILGDYFETYINDFPQSEGQYFTPAPLVNFIIYSLPVYKESKVLDFACGVGHFLTQYAEINTEYKNSTTFLGIDKDNRLAKTAKIASFMHQSDITIQAADALSTQKESTTQFFTHLISNPPYSVKGFLSTLSKKDRQAYTLYNENIDIESNNAIECFFLEKAAHLLDSQGILALVLPSSILNKEGLYTKTREILLRDFSIIALVELGNLAFFKTGTNTIILFALRKSRIPTTNEARFADMQKWLKEANFTRAKDTYEDFSELFREYCAFRNFDTLELEALFSNALSQDSKLLQSQYTQSYQEQINKEKQDYNKKSDKYKKANPFTPSQSLQEYVRDKEAEKFLYFCYCHDSTPLLIKSPQDNATQKKFLGYEWSSKKGKEGIQILASSANLTKDIQTPLYNPKDRYDTSKLNTQILSHFLEKMQGLSCLDSSPLAGAQNDNTRSHSEAIAEESNNTQSLTPNHTQTQNNIPKELEPYAFRARLVDMLDYEKAEFNKAISLNPIRRLRNTPHHSEYSRHSEGALATEESFFLDSSGFRPQNDTRPFANCKYELVRLETICKMYQPKTITSKEILEKGEYKVYGANGVIGYYNKYNHEYPQVAMTCRGATCGTINLTESKAWITGNAMVITPIDDKKILKKFLVYILPLSNIKAVITGSAQPQITRTNLSQLQIPLPPIEIQKQIVEECQKVEKQYQTIRMSIEKYQELIKAILAKCAITESSTDNASIQEILTQLNTLESSLDFDLLFECLESTNADSKDNSGVVLNMAGFSHSNLSTRHSEALAEESHHSSYSRHSEGVQRTTEESHKKSLADSSNTESKAESTLLKPLNLKALLDSLPTPPPQGWERVNLNDKKTFELQIGKRVLDSELTENGTIPVYSANVKKPFGYINKELLGNYTSDSVLWGIDGDWMVGFMPSGKAFYPTDHCGVLRVKSENIRAKILAFGLENEGRKVGFRREYRASLERVRNLQIPLPPLESQDQIINAISKIEEKKSLMDSSLESLEDKKSKILKSVLEST